jgi:hypothetical protein
MNFSLVRTRVLAAALAAAFVLAGVLAAAGSAADAKPAKTAKAEKPAKIDLNTATAAELEEVPGIGPAYAKKIIAARPYASVDELTKSGIPAARLKKILPLVTVREKAAPAGEAGAKVTRTARSEKPAGATSSEARTPPTKGMVWVNTESKVYHLEGDRWYGKTKKGQWMTEDEAIKAGYRKAK